MHREQRERTTTLLDQRGIDRTLFANRHTVAWLTGLAVPASPLASPALVWFDRGRFTLLVEEGLAAGAEAFGRQPGCRVIPFLGYTIEQPIEREVRLGEALGEALEGVGPVGRLGVEQGSLSLQLWRTLVEKLGSGSEPLPIDGLLEPLRAVKTAEELDKMREGFRLTDIAHQAARAGTVAGRREIDVWNDIRRAVEAAAGRTVYLGNDCVVGHRQANIGGPPLDHEIRSDDSLIVDLSVVVEGYWTDSCATYYPGEPTSRQATLHRFVEEALAYATSLVRPGAVAREIDRAVRRFMADGGYAVYPHHTGHGVGLTGHEAPRIVPYNEEVLQEGMVVLLEPGVYFPGVTGVRLEDALLVTADGAQVLTGHDKGLG